MNVLEHPRYKDNPAYLFFENYIIDVVGELSPEKSRLIQNMNLQKVLKTKSTDWHEALEEALGLTPTIKIAILDLWYRNQEIAKSQGTEYPVEQFAANFTDEYMKDGSQVDVWPPGALDAAIKRIESYKAKNSLLLAGRERGTNVNDGSKFPTATEAQLKGTVRTTLDHPQPTAAQLARRERSLAFLERLALPALPTLPVTETEESISPRGAREIADRAVAVAIAAVKGETNDNALAQELVIQLDAKGIFTPEEEAFIENASPQRGELIAYSWSYEALHVLLWSLGHLNELRPPNEFCDVSSEVGIVRDFGRESLAERARLRPVSELLDQADLYYHLHWSAIELRLRLKQSDVLNEGIVQERHRALNWLIRYMNQDWDDVKTDT